MSDTSLFVGLLFVLQYLIPGIPIHSVHFLFEFLRVDLVFIAWLELFKVLFMDFFTFSGIAFYKLLKVLLSFFSPFQKLIQYLPIGESLSVHYLDLIMSIEVHDLRFPCLIEACLRYLHMEPFPLVSPDN